MAKTKLSQVGFLQLFTDKAHFAQKASIKIQPLTGASIIHVLTVKLKDNIGNLLKQDPSTGAGCYGRGQLIH